MSDTDPDAIEPGWITRARSLRELLPVVALGDAIGPATSVLCALLTLAVLLLSSLLVQSSGFALPGLEPSPLFTNFFSNFEDAPRLPESFTLVQSPLIGFIGSGAPGEHIWQRLLQFCLLLVLWFIPAGVVMRQSALRIAGKNRMSFLGAVKFVGRRWHAMLLGPLVPLAAALLLWVVLFLFAAICSLLFSRIDPDGAIPTLIGLPVSLLAGLLLAGLSLALPLIWAAAVIEERIDAFDAASRAFEYLFQRPLRLVFYAVAIYVIHFAITSIAAIVLQSAGQLQAMADRSSGAFAAYSVGFLLHVFSLNLFWALAAGVYLLVRRDQNHREIEDVWEPPQNVTPLPQLPKPDEAATPGADGAAEEGS